MQLKNNKKLDHTIANQEKPLSEYMRIERISLLHIPGPSVPHMNSEGTARQPGPYFSFEEE